MDVLSRGRAWLGIGTAWNADEATGLGIPFPPERVADAAQAVASSGQPAPAVLGAGGRLSLTARGL
ncbi:MAG TPA: hypothetical protein VFB74_26485 [Kribbellaceae bacterium]|nr:hypothetical protein [Kribbellaceae bacterium]